MAGSRPRLLPVFLPMGKISEIAGGRRFPYNLRELLNPWNWQREFKWENQRKKRGWSDRDSWNAGDYIIEVTAGLLEKLGDDKSHIDWDEYFRTNYPNNKGYESLQEVAKDIRDYIAFDPHSWPDDLGFKIKYKHINRGTDLVEMVKDNTPEEERQIQKAIKASHLEWKRRYKKAQKAMTFVAINFPSLWD